MTPYVFPGYPSFLESAAAELDLPRSVGPARRIRALTELANLCAQASQGDPGRVVAILEKAAEFRDHLATALRAAELMLADVETGRRSPMPSESSTFPEFEDDSDRNPSTATAPRLARKAARNERAS